MERRPPQTSKSSATPETLTNAEDEFVEFMASLGPPRIVAETTQIPAPTQPQAGLGHLDALCRLMEQLSSLRQQNCRLQRRVNHLERLQCVHALGRSASGDSLLVTSPPRRGRSRSADGGAAWDAASCEDLPAHLVTFGRRISGDGVSEPPAPRSTSPVVEDGAKSRSLDRTKVAKGMYTSSRLQSQGSGKRSSSAWGRVKTIIQTRRDSLRRRCLSPPLEEECKEAEEVADVADRVEDSSKWKRVKRAFCSKKGQSQQAPQQPAPLQRSQSVPSSPTAHTIFSYEELDLLSGGLTDEGSSSRLSDDAQRHLAHLQRNLSHDFSLKMEEWGRIQQERRMSKDASMTQEELRKKRNSTDGLLLRSAASECAALQRGRSRSDTSLAEAPSGEDAFRATSEPELVLAPGSVSLDRLRVHEQVCQQLQGQLNDLDQHLHEMISVHAKELAKYKSQMSKQCGASELPAFTTLEEHLRHVETAQLRLERTRKTKSPHDTTPESQSMDKLSHAPPFDSSQDPSSLGTPSGGEFGGSASPKQIRTVADVDVEKIQELSEALALQAQQLEDALKERNAAVRQLRWELLATDVQTLRAKTQKPQSPRPDASSTKKRGWTSLEGVGSLFPSKDEEDIPEEEKDPNQRRQEEAFAQELRATVHEMQAGLNVDVSLSDAPVFTSPLDDQQYSVRVDSPVRQPLKQEKANSMEVPAGTNHRGSAGGGGGVRARRMSDTSVPYDPRAPPQNDVTPGLPWDDLPTRVKLDFASAFSTAIYDDEALQQPISLSSSPPKHAPASPSSDSDSDGSGVTFTLTPARPTAPHPPPAPTPPPTANHQHQPPPPPAPTPPPRSPLPPRPPSNVRRMIARFTTPPPSPPCTQRSLAKSSTYSNTPPSPTQDRIAKSATVASVVQGPPPRSPCPRPSRLPRAQNSPSSPRLPQPPSRQIAAVSPVVMRRRVPEATNRVPPDEAKSSFFSFRLCRPRSKRRDSDSGVNSPLELLCRQSLLLDLPHPSPNSPTQPTTPTSPSRCPSSPPPSTPKPKGGWPVKLFRPK